MRVAEYRHGGSLVRRSLSADNRAFGDRRYSRGRHHIL